MDYSSKPRYDQPPQNFSESGQRVNRGTYLGSNPAGNDEGNYLHKTDEEDVTIVDNLTRGPGSTVESSYSCYSLTDMEQFLREEGGRMFNSLNRVYFLPSDDSEWTRIERLHMALHISVGALYPCTQVVRDILKPEHGVSKEILDVGCGSGLWAIEMAKEFPHVNILGVDLVPLPLEREKLPDNFQMEVDDINFGLSHFYGRFDLVHMRSVYAGLKDYQRTLHEIQRCLKPGGIALVFVPELEHLNEGRTTYLPIASDDNPDGSWYQRLAYETKMAGMLIGGDRVGSAALLDKGFWDDDDVMDPETCGTCSIYIPSSPWATSTDRECHNRLQFSGLLLRQSLISANHSYEFVLTKCGLPSETVKQWITRAEEEFCTSKFKSWQRMRVAWGRRRADPGLPAPPLSVPDVYIPLHSQPNTNSSGSSGSGIKYTPATTIAKASVSPQETREEELCQVEVYRSKEESLEVIRRRMALREITPPPLISQAFLQLQQSNAS